MRAEIHNRLRELQREMDAAREALAELDTRRVAIKSQMLRLSGAIHVLQELRAGDSNGADLGPDADVVGNGDTGRSATSR